MSADTTPSTGPHNPAGTLDHIDPATIDIGDNVRDCPESSSGYAEIVASIRTHGVLVPCTAVRHDDGRLELREGQRRVMAARHLGLPTVPVYITPDTAHSDTARTASRITEQIVTNERRTGLTEAQRAKGIQQLLTLGVSPTKVAKTLTLPKKLVDAAAAAATSDAAMAALDRGQLTIEQAAALGEFEQDHEALDYLLASETPGTFDHRISEMRQSADSRAARACHAAQLTTQGFTIIKDNPGWTDPLRKGLLARLFDTEGNSVDDNHPAHPSQAPALWTVFLEEVQTYTDTRTGQDIDEHEIDWDAEADDDAEDGYIHPRFVEESTTFDPHYYCHDIAAAGLVTAEDHYSTRRTDHTADTQDDQRKEAERRDKRKVLALNKLGAAAQDVRRAFVKEKLLSRKTPPKGSAMLIATQLAQHPDLLGRYQVMATAAELLGLPQERPMTEATAALPPGSDARATVMVLGFVLAAMEAGTTKSAWRSSGYGSQTTKTYLLWLEANGYELSEVEQIITGTRDADELFDSLSANTPTAQNCAA